VASSPADRKIDFGCPAEEGPGSWFHERRPEMLLTDSVDNFVNKVPLNPASRGLQIIGQGVIKK